jgi:FkbM family methyltransferase
MKSFIKKILPADILQILRRYRNYILELIGISGNNNVIGKVPYKLFARRGFRRTSFSQQGEDLILDRIMSRILKWSLNEERIYVDVGAYHPIDFSVTYLLYLRGWKGIVFDPSSRTQKLFQRWRRNDIFIKGVVGEEDYQDVDFYFSRASIGEQSLTGSKYPPKDKDMNNFYKTTFKQVNLNNELRRNGFKKIHFLNIDVEGAELEILRTFEFQYFKPSVLAIEIHTSNLEEVMLSEEYKIVKHHGYAFVGSAVITHFFVRIDDL